jgi:hypothetical protein
MLLYILGKGSYQEICYFTRILVGLLELCLPRSKSVLIWFSVIRDSYERKRDYFTKRVKRLTEIKHNSEGLYRE